MLQEQMVSSILRILFKLPKNEFFSVVEQQSAACSVDHHSTAQMSNDVRTTTSVASKIFRHRSRKLCFIFRSKPIGERHYKARTINIANAKTINVKLRAKFHKGYYRVSEEHQYSSSY